MNRILLLLLLFCAAGLSAQPGHPNHERRDRPEKMTAEQRAERFAKIKTARQAYITEALELTPAEAAAFFPVYWDYDRRMAEGRRDGHRGRPGRKTRELTEKEARGELLQRRTQRQQMLTLSLEAEDAFLEILPATKVIHLPEAEREFRRKLWDRARRH